MYAIIAGCNKAGTTSLFRYLAEHPQVSPSRKKETDFFLAELDADPAATRRAYESLFPHRQGALVCLEASPAYLRGGRLVAERIARILPEARLLFLLREPVSRIVSYLRVNSQNLYKEAVAELDDASYVRLVESVAQGIPAPEEPGAMRNALLQYERGCYARFLQQFLEHIPARRVQILFFDDLCRDARAFMRGVCGFLGTDAGFYDHYQFEVENRTRAHRNSALQSAVVRANRIVEPWLNAYPAVRRGLRGLYELINERPEAATTRRRMDDDLLRRLETVYRPQNEALRVLLEQHWPQLGLPEWVSTERGG